MLPRVIATKSTELSGAAIDAPVENNPHMRSGVPDICLPAPRGKYHGLYIEMKVGRNKPTPEQEDFLTYLAVAGYKSLACWGEKSTIRAIESYLKLPKEEEPCIDVPMKSEPKGE